jgi:hypothetical protein
MRHRFANPESVTLLEARSHADHRLEGRGQLRHYAYGRISVHVQYRVLYRDWPISFLAALPLLAPLLGPARLSGLPQRFAPFLRADVAPARGAKANCLPIQRCWREFPARDVEELQREIEHDLHWQSALTHDAPKRQGSSDAQIVRQLRRNLCVFWGALSGS